jgi:alanyl-tRNA synthetase
VLRIEGLDIEFKLINAEKVGKAVLHILDKEIPGEVDELKGKKVFVKIDEARRDQLRAHHTGTHIVFAAARKILGPHVW